MSLRSGDLVWLHFTGYIRSASGSAILAGSWSIPSRGRLANYHRRAEAAFGEERVRDRVSRGLLCGWASARDWQTTKAS